MAGLYKMHTFAYQTVGFMAKNTKDHILESSLLLFLKKSFKAVTVKDIVEKTQVSKGAFYHYFESKQQLFEEVVKHFYIDVFVLELENYNQNSLKDFYIDMIEGTKEAFNKLVSIGEEQKTFDFNHFQLIFEASNLLPEFNKQMEKYSKKEQKYWVNVIKTAQKKEEIRKDINAELVAQTFTYIGDGLGMNNIFSKKMEEKTRVFDENRALYDEYYKVLKI